jgi:4-amino-4-deoxy-L-arabinose transferase-like glycosyltransferase
VFGVYTGVSAWVLLAINSVLSAATAMAVWEIAARCYNQRVARWSGWLWALYPAALQYSVRWVWEMTVTTALFMGVIVLALRMRGIGGENDAAAPATQTAQTGRWALFGLAWGLIALSNSTLLLFLPVCGIWILIGNWEHGKMLQGLRGAILAGLIFLACVTPWTLRNWEAFHAFIPLRGNFGAELYMGDGPGSTGTLMSFDHPHVAPEQLRQYAAMGEVRYVAMRGAMAKAFIHAHPAHFMAVIGRRIYFFWASVPSDEPWPTEITRTLNFGFISLCGLLGLALAGRRGMPASGLFAWAFLLLPLTYYVVTVHARFRHPLEPLITILAVFLFQSAERGPVWSWKQS